MALVYSLATLTERIKRHMANGFPSASFFASDNEIQLYINDAIAFSLVGGVYNMALCFILPLAFFLALL